MAESKMSTSSRKTRGGTLSRDEEMEEMMEGIDLETASGTQRPLFLSVDPADYEDALLKLAHADETRKQLADELRKKMQEEREKRAELLVIKTSGLDDVEEGDDEDGVGDDGERPWGKDESLKLIRRHGSLHHMDSTVRIQAESEDGLLFAAMERIPTPSLITLSGTPLGEAPKGRVRRRLEKSTSEMVLIEAQTLVYSDSEYRKALKEEEFRTAMKRCGIEEEDIRPKSIRDFAFEDGVRIRKDSEAGIYLREYKMSRLRRLALVVGELGLVRQAREAQEALERNEAAMIAAAEAARRRADRDVIERDKRRAAIGKRVVQSEGERRERLRKDFASEELKSFHRHDSKQKEMMRSIRSRGEDRQRRIRRTLSRRAQTAKEREEQFADDIGTYEKSVLMHERKFKEAQEKKRLDEARQEARAEEIRKRKERMHKQEQFHRQTTLANYERWLARAKRLEEIEEESRRTRQAKLAALARERVRDKETASLSRTTPGPADYDPDGSLSRLSSFGRMQVNTSHSTQTFPTAPTPISRRKRASKRKRKRRKKRKGKGRDEGRWVVLHREDGGRSERGRGGGGGEKEEEEVVDLLESASHIKMRLLQEDSAAFEERRRKFLARISS